MDGYIFKREFKKYKTFLNPLEDYLYQMSKFMAQRHNISVEKSMEILKKCIKENKCKDPVVTYKEKDYNGDVVAAKTTLSKYISSVKKEGDIIVPSFTVYCHPSKKKSVHSKLLTKNIILRKHDKKLAFKYFMEGDEAKGSFYTVNQKSRKIKNNSLSGAYGSSSTILYNPSAHFTLTSMTRCVSGVGNSLSETFVAGNRYYRTPNSLINHIVTISTKLDYNVIRSIIDKYKLYKPSPKEVFDYLKPSFVNYWKNVKKEHYIKSLLNSLDPYQLASVVYVNDFWGIKTFNDKLVRNILTKISHRTLEGSEDPLKDLDNSIPGVNELVHHIFMEDIKGREISYKDLIEEKNPLIYQMGSTAKVIKETFIRIKDFIQAFFVTDILPVNTAYIKDMYRKVIVLSDTDSTCCSYDKWVEWYFGNLDYNSESVGLAASVMTILTQVMDHNLRQLAKNINTGDLEENCLTMKNEFFWPVFVTANVTKHYYASTAIQEGNVYKENLLEKKGVHYISSSVGGDIVKESEDLMWLIMNSLTSSKKLSIKDACTKVANLERKIKQDFKDGKCYMFRKDTIKEEKSYKLKAEESKYVNHLLWKEVFSEQYGYPGEPPYVIYNLGLSINNITDWINFINHVKTTNPVMAENLVKFCAKYKKPMISTLRVPKVIADGHGIPHEFVDWVDIKKTIEQSLRPLYYVLETIGYYKKPGFLLSDLNF